MDSDQGETMTSTYSAIMFFQDHGYSVHDAMMKLEMRADVVEEVWFKVATAINHPARY